MGLEDEYSLRCAQEYLRVNGQYSPIAVSNVIDAMVNVMVNVRTIPKFIFCF